MNRNRATQKINTKGIIIMINLTDYGFKPTYLHEVTLSDANETIPARVTAVHRDRYELICSYGQTYGRLKTAEYYTGNEVFPTTGDFVLIRYQTDGESRIVKTLPRRSCFSRLDPSSSGHGEQAVAANFDDVFIMQSLNHDFNPHRLERYLTLAWQSGAVPTVLLTKADVTEDFSPMMRKAEQIANGVPVYAVSAKTGYGLSLLAECLKPGKTVVFLGSSGVGKSSLVNALAGEEIMTVGGIREDDSKGRHTTTHRQLIRLKNGVMIIDTPGMRELGMWDVSDGIGQSFSDVEQYLGKCRFSDCTHGNEPGCAVREAIESGDLSRDRWESYLALKNEAKYSDDKPEYLREKQKWHKSIAKKNRNMKKYGKHDLGYHD